MVKEMLLQEYDADSVNRLITLFNLNAYEDFTFDEKTSTFLGNRTNENYSFKIKILPNISGMIEVFEESTELSSGNYSFIHFYPKAFDEAYSPNPMIRHYIMNSNGTTEYILQGKANGKGLDIQCMVGVNTTFVKHIDYKEIDSYIPDGMVSVDTRLMVIRMLMKDFKKNFDINSIKEMGL